MGKIRRLYSIEFQIERHQRCAKMAVKTPFDTLDFFDKNIMALLNEQLLHKSFK